MLIDENTKKETLAPCDAPKGLQPYLRAASGKIRAVNKFTNPDGETMYGMVWAVQS